MKESELFSSNEFPENFLIDTEGVKFRLPLFVVNERTIIKEWRDGTKWYRIYSDGYCEQGGLTGTLASNVNTTVNLYVPLLDVNYQITSSERYDNGTSDSNNENYWIAKVDKTYFQFYNSADARRSVYWEVKGYCELLPREEWEIDFNYYFKVSHGADDGRINIEEKLTEFEETAYTRLDEIVEEVSKDYVVHVDKQVGELYFSFNDYFPDGVIPLDGRLVSRATYADLWEWVQEKGLVKDDALITTNDENTVSIFNEDGTVRYCQWYGSGDGSLTFRMPKINGYLGATGDNTLAGQYIAEGLPNILGTIADVNPDYGTVACSQAFYKIDGSHWCSRGGGGGDPKAVTIKFDASRYDDRYGNSEHVTPETNTLFVGVWAITATKAAVFDMRDVEEALKSAESYLMNNVPLMSSRWDRDGLGNLGWVKADGSWVDGRHYTGAYNYCVQKLVNGNDDFIDGQIAVITADNCSKFIVDRINKRFRLPISNGQRQLVAAYKEGTQWYNIYSDGWIEQGGEVYNNADAVVTVKLLVPYNDTTYTVDKILGVDGRYTSTVSGDYTSTWGYTTTSFQARTHTNAALNRFRWFAAGYGEILSVSSPLRVSHLYFKLAHEFYAPAQAEIQEKLDLIDNLVVKTDINLPTLSSRWDNVYAENVGWVKSEGHWLNGNTYHDAYELMVSRIGINDKFVEATEGTEITDENADKFLIDTTAVKFRLPLINGERTLVSTYKDGTTWYNCYSDGWVEQGALATSSSVTFLFPFIDANYSLTTSNIGTKGTTTYEHGAISSRTSTGFTWMVYDSFKLMYKAIGHSIIPSVADYNCGNYLFFKLADEVPSTVVDTQEVINDMHQECLEYKADMDAILALGSDYICGCMIPDYTTMETIPLETDFSLPYHSEVKIQVRANHGSNSTDYDVKVNNVNFMTMTSVGWNSDSLTFIAKKGDVIHIRNNNSGNSTNPVVTARFYRLSGASAE